MNNDALQRLVEEVSLTYFKKPFLHQATFNHRLKTTGGRYHLKDSHLDFNPLIYEVHGLDELVGVIKHELCHYHLHRENKGYQHKDREFKELLKATGGSRFCQLVIPEKDLQHYVCTQCQTDIYRKRRINTQRFVCRCGGQLKHLTNER